MRLFNRLSLYYVRYGVDSRLLLLHAPASLASRFVRLELDRSPFHSATADPVPLFRLLSRGQGFFSRDPPKDGFQYVFAKVDGVLRLVVLQNEGTHRIEVVQSKFDGHGAEAKGLGGIAGGITRGVAQHIAQDEFGALIIQEASDFFLNRGFGKISLHEIKDGLVVEIDLKGQ